MKILLTRVLGGLLARKHTVTEWKRVYENIGTQTVGLSNLDDSNPNSVGQVLSLSYEDLPTQLKHCFLYLAHFPEDYKIDMETLFNYWAADGIIMSFYNGATIQASGEDYIEELVMRNMVTADRSYENSRIEYCQMHDMMREVCISKAREENFLQVVVKTPSSTSTINAQSSRSRRLAVHSGDSSEILERKNKKKIRSLLFLRLKEDFWIQSTRGFQSVPLLRVLDLSWVKFKGGKLPSSIGQLVHLRFLSLNYAEVSHLPSSLGNLKLLLYLNLRVSSEKSVHVPNVLKEMLELRYLFLPFSMSDNTKLELGGLVNLEKLWFFSVKQSSVTDLLCMTKLRYLYVYIKGGCTYETLWSSLHELRDLESFSLFMEDSADDRGEVVLDLIHLKRLRLMTHMPRLPTQHRLPPNLAYICLVDCRMEEDPMPILEKLLHLKMVEILADSLNVSRMVCSKGGFPQLCALKIFGLQKLEEWIVEEGSMPCLHTLTISLCRKLKELPVGLKYISSLKELKIELMTIDWKEKLTPPRGQDYYKVQHIPSVQLKYCDR